MQVPGTGPNAEFRLPFFDLTFYSIKKKANPVKGWAGEGAENRLYELSIGAAWLWLFLAVLTDVV